MLIFGRNCLSEVFWGSILGSKRNVRQIKTESRVPKAMVAYWFDLWPLKLRAVGSLISRDKNTQPTQDYITYFNISHDWVSRSGSMDTWARRRVQSSAINTKTELPTNLPNIYRTTQNNTQDFWNIYAIFGFTTEIWDATPLQTESRSRVLLKSCWHHIFLSRKS